MRRIIILIFALLIGMPVCSDAKPEQTDNKDRKRITMFSRPDKKTLIKQRDSLLEANEHLMMELDSLYREFANLDIYGSLTDTDSINTAIMNMSGFGFQASDTVLTTTDSLLSLWYQKRDMNLMDVEPSDIDTLEMISNIPDSVYVDRLQRLNPYISIPYNKIIRNHIVYYSLPWLSSNPH